MKYTEDTLKSWINPLSKTEEERVDNTIRMVKSAINSSSDLLNCTIEVFAQGSYANNTNVRQNSDIDICIMLTSNFFSCYADGMNGLAYGFSDGTMNYNDYKRYIVQCLNEKFGSSSVSVGNKSIQIKCNSYRVNADVIPSYQYRNYKAINSKDSNNYIEGIKYLASNGSEVINYPKIHISNGKEKNNQTNYVYKKVVRIMKRIRNNMVDDGVVDKDKISSFLVECLVWNVPNNKLVGHDTWESVLRSVIYYLWKNIDDVQHQKWGEVSEWLYLFHNGRKWTDQDAKQFLTDMWNYLELE